VRVLHLTSIPLVAFLTTEVLREQLVKFVYDRALIMA